MPVEVPVPASESTLPTTESTTVLVLPPVDYTTVIDQAKADAAAQARGQLIEELG